MSMASAKSCGCARILAQRTEQQGGRLMRDLSKLRDFIPETDPASDSGASTLVAGARIPV